MATYDGEYIHGDMQEYGSALDYSTAGTAGLAVTTSTTGTLTADDIRRMQQQHRGYGKESQVVDPWEAAIEKASQAMKSE